METITLKLSVTVKAKVTETLKAELIEEVNSALAAVDQDLQQFDFHTRRMMAEQAQKDAQALVGLREQIDAERAKMEQAKENFNERLQAAEKLELGSEILRGQMEQLVTVKVGDDLEKLTRSEIVVEDGKIIAFRS
jgi:uncharacterized phage infection (PIP) family protein YhgE